MEAAKYYVYKHSLDGKAFYIGMGTGLRAYNFEERSKYYHGFTYNRWNDIQAEILESFETKEEARKREAELITQYKSANHFLVNIQHYMEKCTEKNELCSTKIEKYIDKPLTKEIKAELVEELSMNNSHGRQMKWPAIKKILIDQGFKITPRTTRIDGKQIRFDVIEKNN